MSSDKPFKVITNMVPNPLRDKTEMDQLVFDLDRAPTLRQEIADRISRRIAEEVERTMIFGQINQPATVERGHYKDGKWVSQ